MKFGGNSARGSHCARVERGGFPLPFTHLLIVWRLCGDRFASANAAALSSTQVVRPAGQRRRANKSFIVWGTRSSGISYWTLR